MEKNRRVVIREKLKILKEQCKPTDIWSELLETDELYEELYTKQGIESISNEIDTFIDSLIKFDSYVNINAIDDVLKTLVLSLNELNDEFDVIGTEEREQLYGFICEVLELIEFQYDNTTIDKYRKW